jgi:hypothetical protein
VIGPWIRRGLVALVLAAVTCGPAAVADDFEWDEISNEDWAVGPDSGKGIFDAVMLFEKVTADHKKLMKSDLKHSVYRRIRIIGATGREWADVEVPFLNLDQKVKEIRGRTVLPDGSTVEFDKTKIREKETFKSKGQKYTQVSFSLPGVSEDCIVEYYIRYDLDSYTAEWIIQKDIPLLRFELNWILPTFNFTVTEEIEEELRDLVTPNYLWLNTHSPIDVQQLPNLKAPERLVVSCGFVPAFKAEPFALPANSLKTKLYTYYGSRVPPPTYWGREAADLEKMSRDFCKKNKELRRIVQRFADLPTDEAKIEAAYNWLRDSILNLSAYDLVEYENGVRKKLTPKDIADVNDLFKYRYGWRPDLDKALVDMLREMNIDAKYCYAKDRFDDLFVSEAKYWQFDRSLVAVPLPQPGKYSFYAVGHEVTPFRSVPWYLEGVQVLLGGANDLMAVVPFSGPDYSTSEINYSVSILDDLSTDAVMQARLTGHDARDVRVTLLDADSTDFAPLLASETEERYRNAKVDSIVVDQLNDITSPVVVSCRLSYPDLTTVGTRLLLKPFDFCTIADNPFSAPERKTVVLFDYACQLNETAFITLPTGYQLQALPHDTSFENEIGRCVVGFQQNGNSVVAQRFFTLNHPFWGAADYSRIQALFQARQAFSGSIVVLQQVEDGDGGIKQSSGR